MTGKDILLALNDVDSQYIQEALPWAAAVPRRRHPVWALAAGLVVCLGLGVGASLLWGARVSPDVPGGTSTGEAGASEGEEAPPVPDLDFAENDTGEMAETGVLYTEDFQPRDLTLEELAYFRGQPGLAWMGGYYLTGQAVFDEGGKASQVVITGYAESQKDGSAQPFPVGKTPVFLLILSPAGGPPTEVDTLLFFLEEPNNQVEGIGVRAGRSEEEGFYIDPVSGESLSAQVTLYATSYTLDGLEVGLLSVAGEGALSQGDAERLAEEAAGYAIAYGVETGGIGGEPLGDDTPNVNWGGSAHMTVLGPGGASVPLTFAPYTGNTATQYESAEAFAEFLEAVESLQPPYPEGSSSRELTREEIASIWDGRLPWEDVGSLWSSQVDGFWEEDMPVLGLAVYGPEGDLAGVCLYGGTDRENGTVGDQFLVTLLPGELDWDAVAIREQSLDILQAPNNTVNGTEVYAVSTAQEQFYVDDETEERVDMGDFLQYQASFQRNGLAVTVYGYGRGAAGDDPSPEERTEAALSEEAARAAVEAVTGYSLYGTLSLSGIPEAPAPAAAPEESRPESAPPAGSASQPEGTAARGR